MAASYGYNVRWAIVAAGGTFNGSAVRFPVVRDTLGLDNEILDGEGATGTRSHQDVLIRNSVDKAAGQIEFEPTFSIFDTLLPYILGGSESSDTFPIADTLPAFDRLKDLSGKIVKHSGCVVSKADLTFGPGLLKLGLDVLAKSETATGLSWSSANLGTDYNKDVPYAFQDCTFSIESATRKLRQGVLTIDNHCEAIYSSGSVTAEEIRPAASRTVTLAGTLPSSSTEWDQLYTVSGSDSGGGATATITLYYSHDQLGGNVTTTITLRKLKTPRKCPVMDGKGEIMYVPVWTARADGSTTEISVTNVYSAP